MLKALWKDPVWSNVIAGALVAAIGAVVVYLSGLWPDIAVWLPATWNWLYLATSVTNWLLLLLSLLAAASLLLLGLVAWIVFTGGKPSGPDWNSYTSDNFFGLRWRWQYRENEIFGLGTFCPDCDYQVFPDHVMSYGVSAQIGFNCDSCAQNLGEFDVSYSALKSKAERSIQQKVRAGTWSAQ